MNHPRHSEDDTCPHCGVNEEVIGPPGPEHAPDCPEHPNYVRPEPVWSNVYRILVTGSREWRDFWAMRDELAFVSRYYLTQDPKAQLVLVHGDCRGVDRLAEHAWVELALRFPRGQLMVERHPADWTFKGRRAGMIRNQEMVDLGADVCCAFPTESSRGTWHCVRAAEAAGIPVRVIYEETKVPLPPPPPQKGL